MGNKLYKESDIQAIANSIRAKSGKTNTYKVSEMAAAISTLSGKKYITTYVFKQYKDSIHVLGLATVYFDLYSDTDIPYSLGDFKQFLKTNGYTSTSKTYAISTLNFYINTTTNGLKVKNPDVSSDYQDVFDKSGKVSTSPVLVTPDMTVDNQGYNKTGSLTTSDIGLCYLFKMNGSGYNAILIDIDHDDLADGSGKAHTTGQVYGTTSETSKGNSSSTSGTNYSSSTIHNYLKDTILPTIDTNLSSKIKEVSKLETSRIGSDFELTSFNTKLFLPSLREGYWSASSTLVEGTPYSYGITNDIGTIGNNGTSTYNEGGFRTPRTSTDSSMKVFYCDMSGMNYGPVYNDSRPISFCFCI